MHNLLSKQLFSGVSAMADKGKIVAIGTNVTYQNNTNLKIQSMGMASLFIRIN
jgi:hypothetical protein